MHETLWRKRIGACPENLGFFLGGGGLGGVGRGAGGGGGRSPWGSVGMV